MKRITIILSFLILSVAAFAQSGSYNKVYGRYEYEFFKVAKALTFPADTISNAPVNSVASVNGIFYVKSPTFWNAASGGNGGTTYIAGNGIIINGTAISVDGNVMATIAALADTASNLRQIITANSPKILLRQTFVGLNPAQFTLGFAPDMSNIYVEINGVGVHPDCLSLQVNKVSINTGCLGYELNSNFDVVIRYYKQ